MHDDQKLPGSVRPGEPIDDATLVTLLDQENRTAVGYLSDEVSVEQDDNLDRYLGKPYGDEEDGSSNVVSFDVAEVVDWALPDLLEPFLSGDRLVEFEPNSREDEAFCEQATELVNHVFFVDNPGTVILHDVAKSAMIQKLGVLKTYWDTEDKHYEEELSGLTPMAVAELENDDTIEILEARQRPIDLAEEIAPAYPEGLATDLKIRRTETVGKCCVVALPPEEFKVSQRSASLDPKHTSYCCHETELTRGQLLEMGFDYDDVMMARQGETSDEQTRRDARFYNEDRRDNVQTPKLSDRLLLVEEYYQIDLDGDGQVETVQAFRIGKTLLSKDIVDEHPFDAWSPDRIPHRLIGQGLADKVKQTQRVKTVLTRQMLDNVYLANNPRMEVPEEATGSNTIQDLLQYRIGGLIRTKRSGMLNPIETPDRSAVALQAITYMDNVREMQSGIVRNGQAIKSDEIDPKSATESRRQDRNSQVRKRLMARMFAETLLVPVFRKILKNLIKYQDAPRTLKIAGQWVDMDPRSWNADLQATVFTGLGHANKEEELGAAQAMLGIQAEARAIGLANETHLWNTGKKVVNALGWHNPEDYFLDPTSEEGQQTLAARAQQQPQEDPDVIKAKGEVERKQQAAQFDEQIAAMKSEAQRTLAERDALHQEQMQAYKLETERMVGEIRAQNEMQLAQLKIDSQERIEVFRAEKEAELAKWKMERMPDMQGQSAQDLNGGFDPGGRLDA